jgi:hypothetical protein
VVVVAGHVELSVPGPHPEVVDGCGVDDGVVVVAGHVELSVPGPQPVSDGGDEHVPLALIVDPSGHVSVGDGDPWLHAFRFVLHGNSLAGDCR